MKRNYILILVAMLLAGSATTLNAQNTYHVEDNSVTVTDNIRGTDFTTIKSVLSRFARKSGYIAKSYYSGKDHVYLDVETPVIAKGDFSEMTAVLRIDARRVYDGIRLTYACSEIDVFFPTTEIRHSYNPADNYPVRFPFDQKKTMIKRDDVQLVFDETVKRMHAVSKRLAMEIREYE